MPQSIRSFSESLPMLLLRAREQAMGFFRPLLQSHGLTEQQWRVLRALNETDGLTASGLAQACVIRAPSLTRMLRSLSRDGYVNVQASARDRRELQVRLSERGRALIAKIGPQSEQQYGLIRDRMHPERLAQLYKLLHEFIERQSPP